MSTLFTSDNAICPFCKKRKAYGVVALKKSPLKSESDIEILSLLIYCLQCQKQVGMGRKFASCKGKLLDSHGNIKRTISRKCQGDK